MKKISLFLMLMIASVVFYACQNTGEEEILPTETELENSQELNELITSFSASIYDKVSTEQGILKFANVDDFMAVRKNLEAEYEIWNTNFEEEWGHLSEDEYADKQDELNFDEFKPLKDFSKSFNVNNLFSKIALEEDVWLADSILGESKDP